MQLASFSYLVSVIFFFFFSPSASLRLSPCAKWNTEGITVAGTSLYGNSSNELSNPTGIFLHQHTHRLYIADHNNARIQMFALNDSVNGGTTVISNLKYPVKIYLDKVETIYIALDFSKRVEKWIKGASQGEQVGEQCNGCSGVWIDEENNDIYMSEWIRNRVSKWSDETENTTTVAGHSDRTGSTAQYLNSPKSFHIDSKTDTVYVADMGNHRVQKWMTNADVGVTVAGSEKGERGVDDGFLWSPEHVFVDVETNVIFVADTNNNRIQRWDSNAITGQTIIGTSGRGNGSEQLNHPTDLTFDDQGNLYVCDSYNNRVQMFKLIDNHSCSKGNRPIYQTLLVITVHSVVISALRRLLPY